MAIVGAVSMSEAIRQLHGKTAPVLFSRMKIFTLNQLLILNDGYNNTASKEVNEMILHNSGTSFDFLLL